MFDDAAFSTEAFSTSAFLFAETAPAEDTPRAGGGPGRRYFPRLAPSLAEIDDDDLGVLIASRPLH